MSWHGNVMGFFATNRQGWRSWALWSRTTLSRIAHVLLYGIPRYVQHLAYRTRIDDPCLGRSYTFGSEILILSSTVYSTGLQMGRFQMVFVQEICGADEGDGESSGNSPKNMAYWFYRGPQRNGTAVLLLMDLIWVLTNKLAL